MSGFLPPSLLQKLKAFDDTAPKAIMTRAEDIQKEQHRKDIIDRKAFKRGFLAPFQPAVFKALFETLANPLDGTKNIRHALDLSTTEESWEKVWGCFRQAVNEYIDDNNVPRETFTARELAWLYDNPSRPLNVNTPYPRS